MDDLESTGLQAWGSENASLFIRIPCDRTTGRLIAPATPSMSSSSLPGEFAPKDALA